MPHPVCYTDTSTIDTNLLSFFFIGVQSPTLQWVNNLFHFQIDSPYGNKPDAQNNLKNFFAVQQQQKVYSKYTPHTTTHVPV